MRELVDFRIHRPALGITDLADRRMNRIRIRVEEPRRLIQMPREALMRQRPVQLIGITDITSVDLDHIVGRIIDRRIHIVGHDRTIGHTRIQIRSRIGHIRTGRIILQIVLKLIENILRRSHIHRLGIKLIVDIGILAIEIDHLCHLITDKAVQEIKLLLHRKRRRRL